MPQAASALLTGVPAVVVESLASVPAEPGLPQLPAGTEPFIQSGSRVTPETTICIIEVMKLMNAVRAGVVSHILVKNVAPIEFGQVLVVINSP